MKEDLQKNKTMANEILLKIYLSKYCESFSVKVDEKELLKKLNSQGFITVGLDISDKLEVIITKEDFDKKCYGSPNALKFFAPLNVIDNCDDYPEMSSGIKTQLRVKEYSSK